MLVENIMTRSTRACHPGDPLAHAAQLMWENDCGAIPVCSNEGIPRVLGIITDRDICMHALFHGKALQELRVRDAMSHSLTLCRPADSLAQAARLMRETRVRRLPVVRNDGTLVGMVCLADLAREAEREQSLPRRELTPTDVGGTLAAISAPGHRL
jgi:CBS domain-containing protein